MLDPRSAARTPAANREPHYRLRYESPVNASPSRCQCYETYFFLVHGKAKEASVASTARLLSLVLEESTSKVHRELTNIRQG